ncbi:hypothetical protein BT96DRAFT_249514 [Gymnopus androsaceus JB14]|uniref:Protein CPL1-like domain-containing protein n=1 Tax=Gymnopus androsaceus JB14 TaxID=1447944 RepID=A0A6A4IKU6_9AGAR|nr:hypothetical protein BT96DRAFT_249514 [Gymnopus androsaceus JB14]
MTVIKRVAAFAILSLGVAPFAAAAAATSGSKTSSTSSTSKPCEDTEFYYDRLACCLPLFSATSSSAATHTTVATTHPVTTSVHFTSTAAHTSATAVTTSTSTPPNGKSCPPSQEWYWSKKTNCCVPTKPLPPNNPPPQCSVGHGWKETTQCCEPDAPSTSTQTSKPSSTPKTSKNGHGKRHHISRDVSACPSGLDACPISGLTAGDYECLDTSAELESCGGCTSIGQGQDCTAIKGAWNVGCEVGSCKVYSCAAGYMMSADSTSCVQL